MSVQRAHFHQRGGIAIAFSLLIVALLTSMAVAISYDMALDVRRTQALLYQEQARLVALGAEDWIGDLLREDRISNQEDHDGEFWAQPLPDLPVETAGLQGVVSGQIIDLQSRFNLNNLVDNNDEPIALEVDRFRALLETLGLEPDLADAVVDWIDADPDLSFPGGAEDDTYTARTPPLNTANRPFRSAQQLALVEGFDKERLDVLLPHVVALPAYTPINANTATAAILQSLDANMSPADVEQIMTLREGSGLNDLNVAFAGLLPQATIATLGLETSYFQLRSVVRIGSVRFTMYSLLYRTTQGDVGVVMRSFGSAL